MIKAIEFPGREFVTKEELFKALVTNKDRIIELKKDQVYKSCDKRQFSYLNADKAMKAMSTKSFEVKDDYIYPVISTTNYLDSHEDVHFKGSMTKTAKEQQGKVKYILDHDLKYDQVIAWPKDVNMFISEIDWSLVGKSYSGTTEALIFEIKKDSIKRKDVLNDIEAKSDDFENSIRMIYHKIVLGINSDNPEFKEQKEYWDKRAPLIANQDRLAKTNHFWGVEELGIYKEGSLVVAGGSNDATSIYSKNIEAARSTSKTEPPKQKGTHIFIHNF